MYGQYALPFVHTPYFLQMSQFDSFSLLYDTGGATPQSPAQLAYADSYQQARHPGGCEGRTHAALPLQLAPHPSAPL